MRIIYFLYYAFRGAVAKPLRKVLLLLAVYAVAVVVEGCCNSPERYDFHSISMSPRAIMFSDSVRYYGRDSSLLVDRRRDSVFAFKVMAEGSSVACRSGASSAPVGLLPRVYAMGECPTMGLIYWITAMDVVSDADWDAAHPAGTSLADLITLRLQQGYKKHLSKSLSKMVFDEEFHLFMGTYGRPPTAYGPESIDITLVFPHPPRPGRHVFTLTASKSNDESFKETSRPVIWN